MNKYLSTLGKILKYIGYLLIIVYLYLAMKFYNDPGMEGTKEMTMTERLLYSFELAFGAIIWLIGLVFLCISGAGEDYCSACCLPGSPSFQL